MNILYLHQYFATPQMAGGTRSYELARRLVERGHRVFMVTSDREPTPESERVGWRKTWEGGIEIAWIPVKYNSWMSYRARVAAFMRFAVHAAYGSAEFRPDVVFATSTPLTIALPAVYRARRSKVPMVFEVRDLWPAVPIAMGILRNPVAQTAAKWLESFAYRHAQRIVALAPGMKDHVVSKGYSPDKVTVIPNGADIGMFAEGLGKGEQIRSKYPWLGTRRLVLYCGAIGKVNGVDYLARIAAAVRSSDPEVRFVVLGSGREEGVVQRIAAELGVLNSSFFMLGSIPKQDVPMWLDAADVAVALITGPDILWKHATQNKFFDALAAGTPILSNFRGWQSEVAEAAGAGIILDPEDVNRSAEQLLSILADSAWLDRAGRAARNLASEQFNRDHHAALLETVLCNAVDEFRTDRDVRDINASSDPGQNQSDSGQV